MPAQDLITQRDVKTRPQFVVEGTTPATYAVAPSSPVYTQALTDAILTEASAHTTVEDRIAGDLDRQGLHIARTGNVVMLKGRLQDTDENLLDWYFNKPNYTGSGFADEHRQFIQEIDDNTGSGMWYTWKGCKPQTATLAIGTDYTTLEASMSFKTRTITSTAIATLDSSLTNDPLLHADMPNNPITYNSVMMECRAASVTVAFDEAIQDSAGNVKPLYRQPSMRKVSGSVDFFKIDETMQNDALSQTKRNMTLKVSSAISLTFVDIVMDPSGEDIRGDTSDATIETHSFTAKSVAVA